MLRIRNHQLSILRRCQTTIEIKWLGSIYQESLRIHKWNTSLQSISRPQRFLRLQLRKQIRDITRHNRTYTKRRTELNVCMKKREQQPNKKKKKRGTKKETTENVTTTIQPVNAHRGLTQWPRGAVPKVGHCQRTDSLFPSVAFPGLTR